MATATTTAQLIREDRRNIVEDLKPTQLSKVKFREFERSGDFREWCEDNPKSCFRRFQISDLATYEIPTISDMILEEVVTQFEVLVAYPADGRYGSSDIINGLEDAMRADQVRIETMIGALSYGNYASGLDLFQLSSYEIEKEEDVYFLSAVYDVSFKRAVDLGYVNLSGTLTGSATMSAITSLVAAALYDLSGTLTGTATATGAITLQAKVSGTLAGVATASGAVTMQAAVTGTMAGAGTMSATTALVASGPTLLADFDYTTPATVGIGGNGTFASANATDEWILASPTANSYANNVGSETLDSSGGGLEDQTAVGLFDGTDYVSKLAWESDDTAANTCRMLSSGATAGDSDSQDFSFRIIFRGKSGLWSTSDYMLTKWASPRGWYLYATGGRVKFLLNDGTNSASVSAATTFDNTCMDGAWQEIKGMFDFSTGLLSLTTRDSETTIDASAVNLSMSNAGALQINGVNGGASTNGLSGLQITYAGVSVGANAQAFYDETVVLPGSDPTGLLTTASRSSLISVPVSATQVAHFAGGTTLGTTQLPIGYNALLSGTGYGLYCNSAVTNLSAYSELFTNWNYGANVTVTDNYADSPDGFRSASRMVTTANNEDVTENITTVASTEYTHSVWVKRAGGTDVGFKLQLYDISNSTVMNITGTLTATDTWQLFSHQGTTGVGGVSARQYIRVETSGDEILISGNQTNLGDARGAYIRTSGASAALVASDYEAVGSAGAMIKSTAGEAELISVSGFPTAPGNESLIDAHAGNNVDRVYIYNGASGRQPTAVGYDSSSVAQWTLSKATATDMSTQENTFVAQWDSTGGLAVTPGADGSTVYNAEAAVNDIGSYTGTDTATSIQVGANRVNSSLFNGFLSRIRIWDGER